MIEFRDVEHGPLHGFSATAPGGASIGIVGLRGSGKAVLLQLAAGIVAPEKGEVRGSNPRRLIKLGESLDLSPVPVLALDAALSCQDPVVKARAAAEIEALRRSGTTVLMSSYDRELLLRLSDEVWWLAEGRLLKQGDPREVLDAFHADCAEVLSAGGRGLSGTLDESRRRGDGRARIETLETLDAAGQPTIVWRSGAEAAIRAAIRFGEPVEKPVIGIMIRTRVGFEVFGTNTDLEQVAIGPSNAGDLLRIEFRFRCDLCPGDYTVTAASHDPDGTPHDWLEDAVAVSVTDARYTAGVANLRARVSVSRSG